jgi:hypothetical protein
MSVCAHQWNMSHVRHGYLVVEGCFKCGARKSLFSTEPAPPLDEYREGEHFWSYVASFQSGKYDLECRACGITIDLDDVNGIMLSECIDPDCEVGKLVKLQPPTNFVYVALCPDSTHANGRCVSPEGIDALTQYFNQSLSALDRKILVVPCKMCDSIDRCRGTIIADTGLTDIQ